MQFGIMSMTLVVGVGLLCTDAIGVFNSSSQMGYIFVELLFIKKYFAHTFPWMRIILWQIYLIHSWDFNVYFHSSSKWILE